MEIEELDLRKILDNAHMGVVIHRYDTSIVYANPAALRLLRLDYQQLIGKDAFDPGWHFLDESGQPLELEQYPVNRVQSSNGNIENEVIGVVDKNADFISWFLVNGYIEGRIGDDNSFIVITFSDVTETVRPFSAEDIVENTQDIVIVTEADTIDYPDGPKIVYVNKAFERLTGYSKAEAIGETPRILQGALTDAAAKQRIRGALLKREAISETLLNYDHQGRPYWIELSIFPLKNRRGDVTHFAAIERDVSQLRFQQEQLKTRNADLKALKESLETKIKERTLTLKKATAKLEKIAYYDPLTNLANRRFFSHLFDKQVKIARRREQNIGFAVIDIDDFKFINDNYGHDVGDRVLIEVAQVLSKSVRSEDSLCRYGGEEFVVCLSGTNKDEFEQCCRRLVESMRTICVTGKSNHIKISISLGMIVVSSQQAVEEQEVYRLADGLMYQAKKQGKDQFVLDIKV
ncbi:diguanylate cyclase [Alteromonas sp. ASW11-36]|uniref:Diguanylate cyclase n=1 Tax=Alteromonas arenosi TaxID=3055817 RepID=A0ABT7SZX1_9ALTE|nr:diguanylate cyclase [Alteromonas sp. ASW11-36]MDM7861089.1 diguanylate cyclase [Alteromonas sp. ASW11-36]